MRYSITLVTVMTIAGTISSCRSTKKLQAALSVKDTQLVIKPQPQQIDTLQGASDVLKTLRNNVINFTTFSAKIKVDYEDNKGKNPDFVAFVRMYKDSVIWISINATLLSFEAFRIRITKDTIIILNKLNKVVEYHPFQYIRDIADIPLDFSVLQDIVIGNPIYVGDSIVSFRKTENHIIIGTIGDFFKSLLTVSSEHNLLETCKLDDIELGQNRTADLSYGSYEKDNGFYFATYREITVAEKTKVEIDLNYKQYEFNKELSFPFSIPRNYKMK